MTKFFSLYIIQCITKKALLQTVRHVVKQTNCPDVVVPFGQKPVGRDSPVLCSSLVETQLYTDPTVYPTVTESRKEVEE